MRAIGVDIGGTKIAAGVVDESGKILDQTRRDTPAQNPAALESAVADAVNELRDTYPDVKCVGVAAAGFVDASGKSVIFAPNVAWRNRPLAQNLEQQIRCDVLVDNDANAAGWAEFQFGAARDVDDMMMLTLGTGLGGALVVNRDLARGAWGFGAEVGHLRVVPDGHLCGCGNTGCWEQYTSGRALVRDAQALATSGAPEAVALLELAAGDASRIDGPMVTALAQQGDPGCIQLLARVGKWLGEGAASVAALLDPAKIVIGGGLSEAGELVLKPTRESFRASLTARGYRPIAEILPAQMGNAAGVVGAGDLARVKINS